MSIINNRLNITNPKTFNKSFVNNTLRSFSERGAIPHIDARQISPVQPEKFNKYKNVIKETGQSIDYLKGQLTKLDTSEDDMPKFNDMGFKNIIKNNSSKDISDKTINLGQNLTTKTVINMDIHTVKLSKIFTNSLVHITNLQNQSISIITRKVDYLMRFQNEVSATFYDDIIGQISTISATAENVINATENITKNMKTALEGRIMTDKTYAEELFLKNSSIQSMIDMVTKFQELDDSPFISMAKGMIETAISSPIKTILKGFIRAITPTSVSKTIKNLDGTVKNLNMTLAFSINDAKYSKNPIVSALANKLLPDEDKSSKTERKYKKKAVAFDGITRRAITRTIPTLLSYILTAYDPHSYPSPLVYDYDKGVFNTEKNVKKYVNGLMDKTKKRVNNLKESVEYNENLVKLYQSNVRFSNSEDKFDKKFESIMKETKEKTNYEKLKDTAKNSDAGKRAKDIAKRAKILDRFFQNEDGTPKEGILTKINNLNDKLNFIITGKVDFESAVEKVLENTLKIGDKAIVVGGKIRDSKIVTTIREHIMQPIKDFFKRAVRKGRSMIDEYILQPVKEVSMDLIVDLIGKPKKGQSIVDRAFRVAAVKWRKSVIRPITNTLIDMRNTIKSKAIEILKPLIDVLKRSTDRMKDTNAYKIVHESVEESERETINNEQQQSTADPSGNDNQNDNEASDATPVQEDHSRIKKKHGRRNVIINIINTIKDNIKLAAKHMEVVSGNIEKIKPRLTEKFKSTYEMDKDIYHIATRLYDYMLFNGKHPVKLGESMDGGLNIMQRGFIKAFQTIIRFRKFLDSAEFAQGLQDLIIRGKTFAANTASKVLYLADKGARLGGLALKLYSSYMLFGIKKSVWIMAKTIQLKTYVVFTIAKMAPPIIKLAGKCMQRLIHVVGNIAKRTSKFALKAAGGLTTMALHLANGGIMLVTGMLNKLFHRENDKNHIKGYVIGGYTQGMRQQIEVTYTTSPLNIKDKFRREDEKDYQQYKKTKNIGDKARKTAEERAKEGMRRTSELLWKAVDKLIDGVSYIISGGMGLLLGGNFGEKLKNLVVSQRIKKDVEEVTKIYITGGTVDGNISNKLGSSDKKESAADKAEDVLEDVIDNVTDDNDKKGSKIKNFGKKIWSKAKKHKKGLAIAGVTAAIAGIAAINSHAQSTEEESQAKNDIEQFHQNFTDKVKDANTSKLKASNNETSKAISKLVNSARSYSDNMKNLADKEKEMSSKLKASVDETAGNIIDTKTSETTNVNKSLKDAGQKASSKASLVQKDSVTNTELGVESKLGNTDNLDDLNVEDMVKRYRKTVTEDKFSENLVFNKLNYNEKLKYADQRILGNSFNEVYDKKKLQDNVTKNRSIQDIVSKFIKGIVGIPLVGFAINVFKKAWENIKNTWGKIKEGAINIWTKIKGGVGGLVDKIKKFFHIGGNNDNNNNSNNGNNGDNSGNNPSTPGGDVKIQPGTVASALVSYAFMFYPKKLHYSMGDPRERINNQGNWADCSSYVGHVYRVVTGSNEYPIGRRSADWYNYAKKHPESKIPLNQMVPGDVVWYPGHVALHIGGGRVLSQGGKPNLGPQLHKNYNYGRDGGDAQFGVRITDLNAKHDGTLHNPNTAVTGLKGNTINTNNVTNAAKESMKDSRPVATASKSNTSTASAGPSNGSDDYMYPDISKFNLGLLGKPMSQSSVSKKSSEENKSGNTSTTVTNTQLTAMNRSTEDDMNKAFRQTQVRNQVSGPSTEQAVTKKAVMSKLVSLLEKYEDATNTMTDRNNVVYINKVRHILELAQQEVISKSDIDEISKEVALIAGGY